MNDLLETSELEAPVAPRKRGRAPAASTIFNLSAALDLCGQMAVDQVVILAVPEGDDEKYVVRRMASCFKNKYRDERPMPTFGCKSAPGRILVWRTA